MPAVICNKPYCVSVSADRPAVHTSNPAFIGRALDFRTPRSLDRAVQVYDLHHEDLHVWRRTEGQRATMRTVDAEVTKVHFEKEAFFTRHGPEFSQRRAFGLKMRRRQLFITARKSAFSLVLTGRWGSHPIHVATTYSSKPISGMSFHRSLF